MLTATRITLTLYPDHNAGRSQTRNCARNPHCLYGLGEKKEVGASYLGASRA